jgi:hypothetical protein
MEKEKSVHQRKIWRSETLEKKSGKLELAVESDRKDDRLATGP